MRRYRILALVLVFLALGGVIALRLTHVSAQTVNVKVTPTTVSRTVLYKINPGQRPAFDQDVMTNLIPVFEEEKKAGILTGYYGCIEQIS
jgi:riboflavin synthase alpha subunit